MNKFHTLPTKNQEILIEFLENLTEKDTRKICRNILLMDKEDTTLIIKSIELLQKEEE